MFLKPFSDDYNLNVAVSKCTVDYVSTFQKDSPAGGHRTLNNGNDLSI